ncbi:hypothetical protein CMK18_21110 [Candidatus Poribacteria bacterium]|nr:hypothetical protein [Candidatus Poribacteria bacterium]
MNTTRRFLSISNRNLLLIIAVVYSFILANLPLEERIDGMNYLNYAKNSHLILAHYFSKGLLTVVFNEPIWLLLNTVLAKFFSPTNVVRIIIFVPATIVAHTILSRSSKSYFILSLLLLIMPQILKNHITHLRQGLAIGLFMCAYMSNHVLLKSFLFFITPFIHISFVFILLCKAISYFLVRIGLPSGFRLTTFFIFGIITALGGQALALMIGVRQQYNFEMTDVSGLGFVFWSFILFLILWQGRRFQRQYTFPVGIIVLYLSTYFLVEFTGRVFESGLLVVILACLKLTGIRSLIFTSAMFCNFLIQCIPRFSISNFGF